MDLVTIAIWIALILTGVGLAAIVIFGLKNLASGRFRPWSIAAMLAPLVVFGIAYALSSGSEDPLVSAMLLTALTLLAAGAVAVLLSSFKGFIGF